MGQEQTKPRKRTLPLRKKIAFAAITVTLVLAAVEIPLRLFDYQSPALDPYESFVLHKPLFIPAGDNHRTSPRRNRNFHDQQFRPLKPAGVVRFFAVGGSTTYGHSLPDPKGDSYPAQLAELLRSENRNLNVEALNCGGLAYASYRLVGIVEECLTYQPDFMIVMTGHNEFLEPRHYGELNRPLWYNVRTMHLLMDVREKFRSEASDKQSASAAKFVLPPDFIEERYIVRSDQEIDRTLDHFRRNLRRIVSACRKNNTPLILCTTASNIRDWAPSRTEVSAKTSRETFDQQLTSARKLADEEKYDEALKICREVLATEPRAATMHFLMGRCLLATGKTEQARNSYILAKDTDAFPHRALSSFNEAVRDIADSDGVFLFDAEQTFADESPDKLPGENLFLDNCHPNQAGHKIFARGLRAVVQRLPK